MLWHNGYSKVDAKVIFFTKSDFLIELSDKRKTILDLLSMFLPFTRFVRQDEIR